MGGNGQIGKGEVKGPAIYCQSLKKKEQPNIS